MMYSSVILNLYLQRSEVITMKLENLDKEKQEIIQGLLDSMVMEKRGQSPNRQQNKKSKRTLSAKALI